MTVRFAQLITMVAVHLFVSASQVAAKDVTFPMREAPRPETTNGVPHLQIGLDPVPELTDAFLAHVSTFPDVSLGPTRVSLPGAVGFQLASNAKIARADAIVGGREFAHMHPDGSLHASLDPKVAQLAVDAGWAIPHPWADQRAGWGGFVMIYTPRSDQELAVVMSLVELSYEFVTGRPAR